MRTLTVMPARPIISSSMAMLRTVPISPPRIDGFAPASGAEAGCCFCACCAGIVLPSLSAHAAPFVLLRTMATVNHRHGDGVVPDGLRRPPRTIAIT